jgi:hypothetical protein
MLRGTPLITFDPVIMLPVIQLDVRGRTALCGRCPPDCPHSTQPPLELGVSLRLSCQVLDLRLNSAMGMHDFGLPFPRLLSGKICGLACQAFSASHYD